MHTMHHHLDTILKQTFKGKICSALMSVLIFAYGILPAQKEHGFAGSSWCRLKGDETRGAAAHISHFVKLSSFAGCLWTFPRPSSISTTSSTLRSPRSWRLTSSSGGTLAGSWMPSIHWWRTLATQRKWPRCWIFWVGTMHSDTRWSLCTLR